MTHESIGRGSSDAGRRGRLQQDLFLFGENGTRVRGDPQARWAFYRRVRASQRIPSCVHGCLSRPGWSVERSAQAVGIGSRYPEAERCQEVGRAHLAITRSRRSARRRFSYNRRRWPRRPRAVDTAARAAAGSGATTPARLYEVRS